MRKEGAKRKKSEIQHRETSTKKQKKETPEKQ